MSGLHLVRGIQCHHLVFIQDDIDWQIWIENSQTPLPRKMVITSKWLAGGPGGTMSVRVRRTDELREGFIAETIDTEPAPMYSRFLQIAQKKSYPEKPITTVTGCIIRPTIRVTTWDMVRSNLPGRATPGSAFYGRFVR